MHCPSCIVELNITERQGVEIDYCPQCRGVWLDRGELDKIIERSLDGAASSRPKADERDWGRGREEPRRGRRGKSLLEELFDFG